ncbi:MAG: hypothetical protein MUC39_02645 [Candidatus Omnitrophica bacterium]|jgi:hypothetical protein|nr:hypothetical protein [Candidatus Omnitrophota bacterium]
MKQPVVIIVLLFLLLILPKQKIFSQSQEKLSKEKIVQIAVNAFEQLEGKIKERMIIYDIANGKWEAKFEGLDREMAAKFDVLAGKDYQAVCLAIKPKPGLKGKNTWVFVDRSTGAVLALYVE